MMNQERLDKAAEVLSGLPVFNQVTMLGFLLNKVLETLPKEVRFEVAKHLIEYSLEYAKEDEEKGKQ
jgi:hypothetical protein